MKLRDDWKWIVILVMACMLAFANSLGGDFVYDDTRQILRNPLIQENGLIWKALTSDVWAFKGDGTVVASNYWRPTFTAWHILNFRLFGAAPFGWHLTNLLLHSGVCVLAFALLRRWAVSAAVAFTIVVVFAVHPVHVESVAWISGSPDLLFALAFLGSLWFAQNYAETGFGKNLLIAASLYAVALGAKEIGILCLPIYYLVLTEKRTDKKRSGGVNTPMLLLGAIALGYFLIRWSILGAISRPPDDAVAIVDAIMSMPMMFAFYLRQIFFPYWLGANYPLEPVKQITFLNFVVPLIISIAALGAIYYLARVSKSGKLAAALLLLPLATAMNGTAFISEQIVHDRYLYLPLLGIIMLVIPYAAQFLSERNLVVTAIIVTAVLSVQTLRYNAAWANELALWSWTANIDDSSFTSMQLGSSLAAAGQNEQAITVFTRSLAKRAAARGYLGRGRAYVALKQYDKAETDLIKGLQMPAENIEAYALYQTYEALGVVYSEQGKYESAIKNFSDARTKLPIYSASLTVNLAVVLYQSGRKDEALRELEAARQQARRELLPEAKDVLLRLGMLYAELGRKDEARSALREYLNLSASIGDQQTKESRSQAAKLLENLK